MLLVEVRLHEGRFHGMPDWPPSPARLFQALVAGGAKQHQLPKPIKAALRWLESRPPPTIAAPHARVGAAMTVYVPNNDLDAKGGRPDRVPEGVDSILRPDLAASGPYADSSW